MQDIVLEPCPFCYPHAACDEYPPIITHEIDESKSWCVHAPCCDFYGPLHGTPEQAAAAWNRRGLVSAVKPDRVLSILEGVLADGLAGSGRSFKMSEGQALAFASALAPFQAQEAIGTLKRELKAEREGFENYKAQQITAFASMEKALDEQAKDAQGWKLRAGATRGVMNKNAQLMIYLEETYGCLHVWLAQVTRFDETSMSELDRGTLRSIEYEICDLINRTIEVGDLPKPVTFD